MPSERIQRQIDATLDQAESALARQDWPALAGAARAVLAMDPDNEDAPALLRAAEANLDPTAPASTATPEAPTPVDAQRAAELEAAAERSGNPLDRLEEGVFVGRTRELERLRAAFDDAVAGRGSVVMLVGEPGSGKTRTTQELESYALSKGAQVLWGRTHETGGAPPYWPWRLIAAGYRAQNPDELRRQEWGPYATELQRIFPALRELFPHLPEPPAVDSQEGQFRLFEAMSGFLRDVSRRVPLLLVLDDLHWADRPTLQLLTHFTQDLAHARVLVLGTYRDTDLDRQHPLSQTLAELNRGQLFSRVALRGLSREETGAYIRGVAHVDPPDALVARIHEETEGNPFFLSEVVNLLTQEGALQHATAGLAIPEGVKEALGRRLDRLSPQANELLQLAAVVGREFDHALLVALTGQEDDAVLRLEEEALAGRVIEEFGAVGGYRFTHALMQETLVAELSAARQVRLHGQIAEALELLYGSRADANVVTLATHYAESAVMNRAHAQKAMHYLVRAAEQAAEQFAWNEAVDHYQKCLAIVGESSTPLDEDVAAINAALSACAGDAYDWRTHWRAALAALDEYRTRDDWIAFAQTALALRFPQLPADRTVALLREASEHLGDWAPIRLRAEIAVWRLRAGYEEGQAEDTALLESNALALARASVSADLEALTRTFALSSRGPLLRGRQLEEAVQEVLEAKAVLSAKGSAHDAWTAAYIAAVWCICLGNIDLAIAGLDEASAYTELRRGDNSNFSAWRAGLLIERGELHQAQASLEAWRQSGTPWIRAQFMRLAELADDADSMLDWLPDPAPFRALPRFRGTIHALRARAFFRAGRRDDARSALVEADSALQAAHDNPVSLMHVLSNLDGIDFDLIPERLIGSMRDAPPPQPGFAGWMGIYALGPRLRGDWAVHFDDLDAAAREYAQALEVAQRERLVIEEARTHQGLANLAERRGDIETARTHLDAAGELFARYGAKFFLDQVIAKKQLLRA